MHEKSPSHFCNSRTQIFLILIEDISLLFKTIGVIYVIWCCTNYVCSSNVCWSIFWAFTSHSPYVLWVPYHMNAMMKSEIEKTSKWMKRCRGIFWVFTLKKWRLSFTWKTRLRWLQVCMPGPKVRGCVPRGRRGFSCGFHMLHHCD